MKPYRLAIVFALPLVTALGTLRPSSAGDNANPPTPSATTAAPFAGDFVGDKLSVVLTAAGDGTYTGEIRRGDNAYPATAHATANGIEGSFQKGSDTFAFSAALENETLTLISGGVRFEMKRVANVNAAPLPAGELPAGYSELGVNDSGRSIFFKSADLKSVDVLIQRIGDDMGKVFDAKPAFAKAYVDSNSRGKGIASFTASLKGIAVKGMVMFGVDAQAGSSASIVYSRPDAPKEEIDALIATLPAKPKTRTFQFPDQSGSIDLPEGWTPKMQSLTAGAWVIAGPANQMISFNSRFPVDTPNSFRVQTARKNYNSAVNLWNISGRRGPTPASLESRLAYLTISPYLKPEDALKTILPMNAEKARAAGQPWLEYGPITATKAVQANPLIPGAEAAVFAFSSIRHDGDKTDPPRREIVKIETASQGDTWVMMMDRFITPETTFARDLPVMSDIIASAKIADGAVERQMAKDSQAFQATLSYFAAKHEALMQRGREFQENQQAQFERHEAQIEAQAKARHDANSDTIEMALGLRDVYDTATGKIYRVNLYDAQATADLWNGEAGRSNQFVPIPLRYER